MLLSDLMAAFTLLTRLPVPWFARADAPPDLTRCVWAFPAVGLVMGALGGLVYCLVRSLGLTSLLAACGALMATTIATGALHEDGLADTFDGFGGGSTVARKLEIMRDSRIGTYGTLGLLFAVLVRVAAIGALDHPRLVIPAMIASGMLGRGGMLVVLLSLRPARKDGMGAAMRAVNVKSAVVGLGLAVVASLLILPIGPAIFVLVLGLGTSLAVTKIAHRQIGGYTGDVLGACEMMTECVALTVAAHSFSI